MSHDDFAFEPVEGLPAVPPKGEEILWQGKPDTMALAREALALYWVIGYFVVLAVWRGLVTSAEAPIGTAILSAIPFLILGALVSGLLIAMAWFQARATVYTITTRRVALRIGAALSVTLNLPYNWIGDASLDLRKGGTGTIALQTMGETKISYLVCWPHVRPWRMGRTQPALRCIPDAARVAKILAEAAETRINQPIIERATSSAAHGSVAAE